MKRGLWLALWVAALCAAFCACAAEDGYTLVSQDGVLALHANFETGEIIVEDTRDGTLWRSNPAQPDVRAKGVHKMTLQSQIVVGYTSDRGTALTALSQPDSVRRDGLSMRAEDGTVISVYTFPKQELSVEIRYTLENGALVVSVPSDRMLSQGVNTVTSVDVLPAFGAAGEQEEGYWLLPDGSGALMRFHNGVTAMNEYTASIYDKDPSVTGQLGLSTSPALARTYEQTARLPVFGVCKGDHGFVAIITENDSKAVLHARTSNLTSYNTAYSTFQKLSSGTIVMNKKEFEQSLTGVSEREGLTAGAYTVRYEFLTGADSGYAGMARAYRDYLKAERGLETRAEAGVYPLYMELYGYVNKTANLLGIPYQKAVPLTALEDVSAIAARLQAPDTVIRYRQYLSGTAYGKLPVNAAVQSVLGSARGLTEVNQSLEAAGVLLYPDADLTRVYAAGNGFIPLKDAVLTPVNTPQMQYQPRYEDSKLDTTVPPWYLLSPMRYGFYYDRFFDAYESLAIGRVSLDGLGETLTSDNRTGGMGRQTAQETARAVLNQARERLGDLMISGGNAYAAALATHVIGSPPTSSAYILCAETVPFWQMVFHGEVYYSLSPVNHAGDADLAMLQCLEYGASPLYSFVGRNQEALMDSRMTHLYSADWEAWADEARGTHAELRAVLARVSAEHITGHAILSDHARRTDYETIAVYVNYGSAPFAADGVTVPARGYAVMGRAEEAQP